MKYVGRRKELMEFVFNEQYDVDIKSELRQELKNMIKKDNKVKDDLKIYQEFTGLSLRTKSLTINQLNDMINFCTNNQITREKEENSSNKYKFRRV